MFFKKKKKTDSKIRFQQTGFRHQLQSARGYKRQTPPTGGKSYIWQKIGAVVIILAAVYVVYVPNFLSVKNIKVSGVNDEAQQQIISLTKEYLKTKPLSAQNNWLFISAAGLKNYILDHENNITGLQGIKKTFPATVTITAIPRTIAFNIETPSGQLIVSNDGVVQQDITTRNASSSIPTAGLIAVTIDAASSTPVGSQIFSGDFISNLTKLKDSVRDLLKLTVDHFEIADLQTKDVTVYVTEGFKLVLNNGLDLTENLNHAQLVLGSLQDSQKKNLYYIDLRFMGKGFTCYKNTPCAQNIPIQTAPTYVATSTP